MKPETVHVVVLGRRAPRQRLLDRLRALVLGGLRFDDARRLLGVPDDLHRDWLSRGERGYGMDPRDAEGATAHPGLAPEAEYFEVRLRCGAEARSRLLLERFRRAISGGQGAPRAGEDHLAYLEEGEPSPGVAVAGGTLLARPGELARAPAWARAAFARIAHQARALAAERDAVVAALREGREIEPECVSLVAREVRERPRLPDGHLPISPGGDAFPAGNSANGRDSGVPPLPE